jgi:hypothetical protein
VYGPTSLVIIHYIDDEGRDHYMIINSEEGARMGCVWGAVALGIAAHVHVYEPLHLKFPEMEAVAICDDLIPFINEGGGGWQEAFRDYANYLEEYQNFANPIGLYFNFKKSFLLLPPGAPWPNSTIAFPAGLTITREGVVVGGVPIGTTEYMQNHAFQYFGSLERRLGPLEALQEHGQSQMALSFLKTCQLTASTHYVTFATHRLASPSQRRQATISV